MTDQATPHQAPTHPLVKLAVIAVETYIREHRIIPTPVPLSEDMAQRHGVFVTLIKDDQLRGSLGTLRPLTPNVATEVIHNAIGAATHDSRFTALTSEELPGLHYVVDLIENIEPVSRIDDVDPASCGLVVRSGRRVGAVLPRTQGIEDPARQLDLALRKAGIAPTEPYRMGRFSVRRLL